MKRAVMMGVWVALLVAAGAIDARAQMTMGTFKGYLTGHVGMVAGGDVMKERLAAGASIAVHETSGWGEEVDFGRSTDVDLNRQQLDLTTYFVNAAWVKPLGVVRPFGTIGAGIMQTDGCGVTCGSTARTHDFGVGVGGGALVAINDMAALRADARYFFSAGDHPELRRPDNLGFWRISVGATFMWAVVP